MSDHVSVIVNPAAGRGRGGKMVPEISARFSAVGVNDIALTSARGDEDSLATAAIERGATTIVVVGGDGTSTHVANTILKSGRDVRLAVLPAGTGNDFAKVLGTVKCDIAAVARRSVAQEDTRVDVGLIEDRYFLNCCGFGFDVAVLEGIHRNSWLRGNAVYLYTALKELLAYKGMDAAVAPSASTRHMLIVFANTEYFGGMFRIAPGARVSDGELDMIDILNIPAARRLPLFAAATKGAHLNYPECIMERAKSFEVVFPSPPTYETDGELHHAASSTLTVSSSPAALRVVTASTR